MDILNDTTYGAGSSPVGSLIPPIAILLSIVIILVVALSMVG